MFSNGIPMALSLNEDFGLVEEQLWDRCSHIDIGHTQLSAMAAVRIRTEMSP